MARGSKEQVSRRRDEILDACDALYHEHTFHEITMKLIAEKTSFSRPSLYNYFETIDEIFLGLLQREYDAWAEDLNLLAGGNVMAEEVDAFSSTLADTLEKRRTMLKIQSLNLHEIEDNSRQERLTDFKRSFLSAVEALDLCLVRWFPALSEEDRETFRYAFFPFLSGVYPYTEPTEKQRRAMEEAGVPHPKVTIRELTERCTRLLLRGFGM